MVPGIIAGGISGGLSGAGQWLSNAQQAGMSREQMAFQERMSNTSWQRAVKDMKKAGINPMLAVSRGGGASTPSGAQTTVGNVGEKAASGAMSALQTLAQTQQIEAQTRLTGAQTKGTQATTDVTREGLLSQPGLGGPEIQKMVGGTADKPVQLSLIAAKMLADIRTSTAGATKTEAETLVTRVLEDLRKAEIPQAEMMAKFYKAVDDFYPWLKTAIPGIQGLINIIQRFRR